MALLYFQSAIEVDPLNIEALAGCSHLYSVLEKHEAEQNMLSRLGIVSSFLPFVMGYIVV
jgi:hypothetical protein